MANKTANTKHKPVRRALRANEYYNPKTKRYEYHYIDAFGKKRVVSSYILEATDQVPKGKRAGQSLREKEAEVNAKLVNNLDIDGSKLTLLEIIDRYLNSLYNRKELAHATKVGYNVTINCLKQYRLGYMEIGKIKPEHCEEWLADMKKKNQGSSIQSQISLIKRSFEYAVDYDYIAKNPFRRITTDRSDSKVMEAISVEDMNRLFLATRSRKTIVRAHVEEYLGNCIKRFNNANPENPIRKFEPHICRHTFATNMQRLPLKTLQSVLGHGDVRTTMTHYVDPSPSAQQLAEINAVASSIC